MGFDSFEIPVNFYCKCKTCGKQVPIGVASLATHWSNCTGAGFEKQLMSRAEQKDGKLSQQDVEAAKAFLRYNT